MTYSLSEPFNDAFGRWDGFAPWDATEGSDSAKGFLTSQKHVDLRSFRALQTVNPIPQNPNLDTPQQTAIDIAQSSLESVTLASSQNENWVLGGTGLNAITLGAIAGRGGWSGLQTTTTGVAINATLTSSLSAAIDISTNLTTPSLSIIFPDYNSFDTATSYVQLTSDPAGAFGTGHDSAQVFFSANTAAMPHLKLPVSSFAQSGFDATKVTGVKIGLVKATAPAGGLTVTVMAIRSLDSAWVVSWLDFDTRSGAVCRPVTLDALPTTGTVAENFQFVRGDGTKSDPIPADLAMNVYFYPGGSTTPNDATGANYNTVAFIMREQKDTSGGTGSHIEAGLQFNDTNTIFYSKFVSTSGGSPGVETDTGNHSVTVGGPLDATKLYLFRVQLRGTQVIPSIWQVNSDHSIVSLIWQNPGSITDAAYVYRNGRVGFIGSLLSRDSFIDAIDVAPTGFAELETVSYTSRTPVDGAQLSAVYSPDENLFTSIAGNDMIPDSTKTISGNGSYRATLPMTTNTFLVDDWTQMYLELAIWVSNAVSSKNQPQILLNIPGGSTETLPMTNLKPSQWNTLYFDLGVFRDQISASQYSFTVQPGLNPDKPLGFYWVDSINIGRRRVAWSARATSTGLWREFKEMVNNPDGGIHFTPEERGTALQLKADALTEDAWVGSFHLFPRYAQLGLPRFDQGGTYENFAADQ